MIYVHLNNLIVILITGALILLTYLAFLNPLKVNKKGNVIFGVFLLLYASFWMEEVVALSGFDNVHGYLLPFVHGIQIATPLFFYFSVVFYTNPVYKMDIRSLIHLILPFLYIIIQFVRFIGVGNVEELRILSIVFILIQAVFYIVLSWLIIQKHQKRILIFSSNTSGISLKWLSYIILQIFILSVVFILHNIFVSTRDLSLFANLMQLLTVYFIAFHLFTQKEIYPVKKRNDYDLTFMKVDNEETETEKKKIVSDKELLSHKNKLVKIMENKQPFLDPEINLVRLAEMLDVTPHQLSYIINSGFEENFFQFVNRYRVEKAKELLKSGDQKLTMLAVAFDSGFNSKTTFNTTFKKLTTLTPSEFKKRRTDL